VVDAMSEKPVQAGDIIIRRVLSASHGCLMRSCSLTQQKLHIAVSRAPPPRS